MNTHPDFEELLRLLEEKNVDYMIVGGYAVAYHGHPRFTKDLDLFFRVTDENVCRLRSALVEFGFTDEDVPAELFAAKGNVVTFGVIPTRVDLVNDIDGVTFDEVWPRIVRGTYGNVQTKFIGRDDLIKNKEATSRARDKGDAEELRLY